MKIPQLMDSYPGVPKLWYPNSWMIKIKIKILWTWIITRFRLNGNLMKLPKMFQIVSEFSMLRVIWKTIGTIGILTWKTMGTIGKSHPFPLPHRATAHMSVSDPTVRSSGKSDFSSSALAFWRNCPWWSVNPTWPSVIYGPGSKKPLCISSNHWQWHKMAQISLCFLVVDGWWLHSFSTPSCYQQSFVWYQSSAGWGENERNSNSGSVNPMIHQWSRVGFLCRFGMGYCFFRPRFTLLF